MKALEDSLQKMNEQYQQAMAEIQKMNKTMVEQGEFIELVMNTEKEIKKKQDEQEAKIQEGAEQQKKDELNLQQY